MMDDSGEAELLNRYLAELQAGGRPDREAFLRDHPALASALRCLEVLEEMAPLPAAKAAAGDESRRRGSRCRGSFRGTSARTNCWARSAAAAWAWSTRRGKRTWTGRWP